MADSDRFLLLLYKTDSGWFTDCSVCKTVPLQVAGGQVLVVLEVDGAGREVVGVKWGTWQRILLLESSLKSHRLQPWDKWALCHLYKSLPPWNRAVTPWKWRNGTGSTWRYIVHTFGTRLRYYISINKWKFVFAALIGYDLILYYYTCHEICGLIKTGFGNAINVKTWQLQWLTIHDWKSNKCLRINLSVFDKIWPKLWHKMVP